MIRKSYLPSLIALILSAVAVFGEYTPLPNEVPHLFPERYPGFGAKASPLQPFNELPREFNWCSHPTGGCTASWNQHLPEYFPLCYLHSTLAMAQDRIRHLIHGYGIPDVTLSRQDVLDCDTHFGYGRNPDGGGGEVDVLEYMRQFGIPDETCNPFQGHPQKCDPNARCRNCMMLNNDAIGQCWPVENYVKYRVKDYGHVVGEQAMMSEIIARGPIVCGLALRGEDFTFGYRGGVYVDAFDAQDVDHSVEVVGWTEAPHPDPEAPKGSKIRAWIIRNSWGTFFGHNGFFLLERGVNSMRIEEQCVFANMDISELESHLRGDTVGSHFGIIPVGSDPKMMPDDWNSRPHKFMTNKEIEDEENHVKIRDEWMAKNVDAPKIEKRGSIVYPKGYIATEEETRRRNAYKIKQNQSKKSNNMHDEGELADNVEVMDVHGKVDTNTQDNTIIKTDSRSDESRGSDAPIKPTIHKVSTMQGFLLLTLAFALGMGLMVLLAHSKCAREEEGYDSIPQRMA